MTAADVVAVESCVGAGVGNAGLGAATGADSACAPSCNAGSIVVDSIDGRGLSWSNVGVEACASDATTGSIDGEGFGGAADLRAGARGLKLAAPFFFKSVLMRALRP